MSPAHTTMPDFWPPEPGDHKCLLFRPWSVVLVTAAQADHDIHTVCFVLLASSLPSVIVPTLKGWHHNPSFPLGETEALSWLRSHSQKSSPGPSSFPGQADFVGNVCKQNAVCQSPSLAPAPLTLLAPSHTREPSSRLSLLRCPADPDCGASHSVPTTERPGFSSFVWSIMLLTFQEFPKSRFTSSSRAGRQHAVLAANINAKVQNEADKPSPHILSVAALRPAARSPECRAAKTGTGGRGDQRLPNEGMSPP